MMIRFIGVGSLNAGPGMYHSNVVITSRSGRKMLIDCGGDARFSLAESGLGPLDLDAVYVSHLHADHVGGLEWLAFTTHFQGRRKGPVLLSEEQTMKTLWNSSLCGGLGRVQGRGMVLEDYFHCRPLLAGEPFFWEDIRFTMHRMPHIENGACSHSSYGLFLEERGRVFITTDTQFVPEFITETAESADLIFHDCETSSVCSRVHAHYEQLRTLPPPVKNKIWLYHYQEGHRYLPAEDGFRGFVAKGQEFRLP